MRKVLLEAVLIGAAGVFIALASNAISPHGLKLSRNYSPGGAVAALRATTGTNRSDSAAQEQLLANQLRTEGLQLASSEQAIRLFSDPRKAQDVLIFIDARDDDHYLAGHIPGAYQLDHYHPEKYLAVVLPVCQQAEQIVVYCKGGSCEDSEQTAIFLRDAGIPKEKLFVYAGGFDEWSASHKPIETGQRGSGQMQNENAASPASQGSVK